MESQIVSYYHRLANLSSTASPFDDKSHAWNDLAENPGFGEGGESASGFTYTRSQGWRHGTPMFFRLSRKPTVHRRKPLLFYFTC